jgi:outer membrane protein assembly factor BamA
VQQVHISVDGTPLPLTDPLYAKLKVKPDQIFDGDTYQAGEDIVRDYYRDQGYARATTQRWAEVNVSEGAVRVWYAQPGVKGVFGKTSVVGNKEVATYIITRELAYQRGERFSQRKLDETRDRLLKLGFFSVVRLSPRKKERRPADRTHSGDGQGKASAFDRCGGRIQHPEQFIASFAWHDMNWIGGERQLTAAVRYSNIDSYARVTLTQPYLFNSRAITGILSVGEAARAAYVDGVTGVWDLPLQTTPRWAG